MRHSISNQTRDIAVLERQKCLVSYFPFTHQMTIMSRVSLFLPNAAVVWGLVRNFEKFAICSLFSLGHWFQPWVLVVGSARSPQRWNVDFKGADDLPSLIFAASPFASHRHWVVLFSRKNGVLGLVLNASIWFSCRFAWRPFKHTLLSFCLFSFK